MSPWRWSDDELAEYAAQVCPSMPLDPGIMRAVRVLRESDFARSSRAKAGRGHSYPEPTIAFQATRAGGWHALAWLMDFGFPVKRIEQLGTINEGGPNCPEWHVTFDRPQD